MKIKLDNWQTASTVKIKDTGGFYDGNTIESALEDLADGTTLDPRYLKLDGSNANQNIDIGDHSFQSFDISIVDHGIRHLVGNSSDFLIQNYATEQGFSFMANDGIATTEVANLDFEGNLTLNGIISATNLNISNWNTAYGWGNHASAGYLTSSDQYWARNSLASGILSPKTTSDSLFATLKFYSDTWHQAVYIKDYLGNIRWAFHPTWYSTVLGSYAYPNPLTVVSSVNQTGLIYIPTSTSTSDHIQIRDQVGSYAFRQDFQNNATFIRNVNAGGNINGLPAFNRLSGANKRYTVSASGGVFAYSPDYLFVGNIGSPQARFPVDTAYNDYIEIDFNPFIGYTANTATGFTYVAGNIVLSFYASSSYDPTNIKIDAYRYSGGSDSWTTWKTITSNTATNLIVDLPASFNYLKKIRIYMYSASNQSWISNIAYFPTSPESGSKEKEYLSKYSDLEEDFSAPKWTFRSSSWTSVGKFEPRVTDGASAVAWLFDTENTLSTSGAKIASFKNASTEKAYVDKDGIVYGAGGIKPASMADASAPNDCIYYSTTASKLVYKDSGGTVNNLY